jgi:hypothetical protein
MGSVSAVPDLTLRSLVHFRCPGEVSLLKAVADPAVLLIA